MRVFRGLALGATAVSTLLALAACGPADDSASAGGATTAATTAPATAAPTTPAGGGPGGTKQSYGVAQAVQALNVVEKQADQETSARIESSVTVGSLMSTVSKGTMDWSDGTRAVMSITYTGGSLADSLRKVGFGGTMQARYLPDAYYVNMGPKMAAQIHGRHWIRYGYADLAKAGGSSGAYLADQLANNTPTRSVDYVLASKDVHQVGAETVRGVPTTHYAGTVNVADMTAQTSHLSSEKLSQLLKTLKQSGTTTEKVDLWVSAKNLPVKATSSAHTATGDSSSTTYYSDFGVKVPVAAPPRADWENFSQIAQ